MKNLNNYILNKRKVLFRADLNIPVIDGKITDDSRIEAIKPSIKKLLKHVLKAKIKKSTHSNLFAPLSKRHLMLTKYIF